MVMARLRFIRGLLMCRLRCCSLITDQAAATGATMAVDLDGGAESIILATGATGATTAHRVAVFAAVGPAARMGSIDRDDLFVLAARFQADCCNPVDPAIGGLQEFLAKHIRINFFVAPAQSGIA